MEPRQMGYHGGVERQPVQPGAGEVNGAVNPERPLYNPESAPERRPEQPASQEVKSLQPPALPSLPAPIVDDAAPPSAQSNDTSLLVASDDDLIEKEWVEKAKQIIASTKDDPYRREQEVGKLQIEYIRKRYGREIGETTTQ